MVLRYFLIAIVLICAAFACASWVEAHAASADEATSAPSTKPVDRQSRLQRWREARFGMFIHWGLYSSLGNEFHGKPGGTYAEHIQRILKIPIAQYRDEVAAHFDPVKFDADAWVKLAHDAGMRYLVITAKHHDGFAMWPTKVNDYNVVDATPWHHDPMADLKRACDKYGLMFGFYYSHAFDWGTSNGPGNDWDYSNPGGDKQIGGSEWWKTKPEFRECARQYVDQKAIPQIRELITMYHPDMLWFDTPGKLPPEENQRVLDAVRAMDPNILINGRLVWGKGDYDDTCDTPIEFPQHRGDWEAIPTTNRSYGWNPLDTYHKPPSFFIQLLAKASARGGNILMNIGPMGDGAIDPKDIAILQGIGDWFRGNGDSIHGAARTPLAVQTWGQSTVKGDMLYLHVFHWPSDGQLVIGGLKSNVRFASILGDDQAAPLTITRDNSLDVRLRGLPADAPDAIDSVIAVQCDGPLAADDRRLLQSTFASEELHVFDAKLSNVSSSPTTRGAIDDFGKPINQPSAPLRFGAGSALDDFVQGWTSLNETVAWPVRLDTAATYDVSIDYVAEKESDGNEFVVRIGEQALNGVVKFTPGSKWAPRTRVESLGEVTLPAGDCDIVIQGSKINGKELFNPRKIILTPKAYAAK